MLAPTFYSLWTPEGELLSSRRYSQAWPHGETAMARYFSGRVGDRVVMQYHELPPNDGQWHELKHGIRIYDLDQRPLDDLGDDLPRVVSRMVRHADGTSESETRPGAHFAFSVRGETIVRFQARERRLEVLDASGELVESRELEYPIEQLFIDSAAHLGQVSEDRDGVWKHRPGCAAKRALPRGREQSSTRRFGILAIGRAGFETNRWYLLRMRPGRILMEVIFGIRNGRKASALLRAQGQVHFVDLKGGRPRRRSCAGFWRSGADAVIDRSSSGCALGLERALERPLAGDSRTSRCCSRLRGAVRKSTTVGLAEEAWLSWVEAEARTGRASRCDSAASPRGTRSRSSRSSSSPGRSVSAAGDRDDRPLLFARSPVAFAGLLRSGPHPAAPEARRALGLQHARVDVIRPAGSRQIAEVGG